jgi:DNA-directed RNA polymerase subunit RPC12/RpoP
MGVLAATEVLALIEKARMEPRRIFIKPELVIRQSTVSCPQGNHKRNSKVRPTTKVRGATTAI